MTNTITLLPDPQQIMMADGEFTFTPGSLIALAVPEPGVLRFTAHRIRQAIMDYAAVDWDIVGGSAVPDDQIGLLISLEGGPEHEQGYHLTVEAQHITIQAHDAAGAFYGVGTLIQLLKQFGPKLPALRIEDWPDFSRRGVLLDISRDKVPTMQTLYMLVDRLAGWKINEFQLYTEHTFAFRQHPDVWADASPVTAEEILALDAYCRERFIDLVPNQNSFGHMHRWFEHEQYLPLAETERGFSTPWGTYRDLPFSLTPANPDTLPFVTGLFAELLPNFTSPYFNVGCDETWDLGQGRSKALTEEKGKGRVYLEFLLAIYDRVKAQNRTMQFWGDIIGNHPELVPELPKDAVAMEWGYEADHDFPGKAAMFAESGIPFYVCPGTSSWCSITGRTENAIANIRSAAENGLAQGAIGLLNTDWGDGGHWQPLSVSYLGFAYGAAVSWAFDANKDLDLPEVLSALVFEDKTGVMGQLVYDLGNVYRYPSPDHLIANGSLFFWAYVWPLDLFKGDTDLRNQGLSARISAIKDLPQRIQATLDYIDQTMARLNSAEMACPDAALIGPELALAADMLRHGAQRMLTILDAGDMSEPDLKAALDALQDTYRALWLKRNRPGGLEDSLKRMAGERQLYE